MTKRRTRLSEHRLQLEVAEVVGEVVADQPELGDLPKRMASLVRMPRQLGGSDRRQMMRETREHLLLLSRERVTLRLKLTTRCLVSGVYGLVLTEVADLALSSPDLDAVVDPNSALATIVEEWDADYRGSEDSRGQALADLINFVLRVCYFGVV